MGEGEEVEPYEGFDISGAAIIVALTASVLALWALAAMGAWCLLAH
jgi:hypothetical protein